jgi:hypothetical protein
MRNEIADDRNYLYSRCRGRGLASENPLKQKNNSFIHFSSLGIQMATIIFAFGFLGDYLDVYLNSKRAYWTIGLLFLGVVLSLYIVIKGVLRNEK